MLSLLWLTVSLPFVYEATELLKLTSDAGTLTRATQEQDNLPDNPLATTTEEKTESSINVLEEFIHHSHDSHHCGLDKLDHGYHDPASLYLNFAGEIHLPPPRV